MNDRSASHRTARSAYLHVPFCAHRCGYCNFTLVAGRDDLIGAYLQAIALELAQLESARPVDTLFFGGGTPTHLSCEQLDKLLGLADRWLPLEPDGEFSVEANPADLTEAKLQTLADGGVTRISLGAQSFQTAKLRQLERDHSGQDVARVARRARRFIPQLAIDLIFGVPGETIDDWQSDLNQAIDLQPDHISTYGLTFERGTAFGTRLAKGTLEPLGEETERTMVERAIDTLTDAGFEHYEVSNFARPGHRCRHNEVYWSGDAYLAAGPGAARFVGGVRETNHRSTTTYIKRMLAGESPVAERESLDPESAAREHLVFALRRLEGISLNGFQRRTGFDACALVAGPLDRFLAEGLLKRDDDRLRLTRDGLMVSDGIWPHFLT